MNQPTEGRILLVGEGNFSLSSSLVENGTASGPQLTASCIDTFTAVQESHRLAASNIEFLEKAGATVLFEVDAVDMHNHPDIKFHQYERVIFNFPLADRHNIKKNRALLSDFFSSVKNILDPKSGKVMVTLCKGQGGTPADQPMRSWHDSWQVVSMAANSGLILTQIYPFQAKDFPCYQSVGFRFQDKGFSTDNALTHVFEIARSVSVPSIDAKRCFIRQENVDFVVPAYIRRKLDRWSLLEKENHPLYSLHHHLVTRFSAIFPSITVLDCNHPGLPRVLSGHKAWLTVDPCQNLVDRMETEDTLSEHREVETEPEMGHGDDGDYPCSKQLKDLRNLETAAARAEDCSGDAKPLQGSSAERSLPQASGSDSPGKTFKHGVEREVIERKGENAEAAANGGDEVADVFPSLHSPVFVVHKLKRFEHTQADGNSSVVLAGGDTGDSESDMSTMDAAGDRHLSDSKASAEPLSPDASEISADFEHTQAKDTPSTLQSRPAESGLLHLRCSLLENLTHLSNILKSRSSASVMMSGTVFCNCPVSFCELPMSHETIFLAESEIVNLDDLTNQLFAALRAALCEETAAKMKVRNTPYSLTLGSTHSINVALMMELEGMKKCSTLGYVFRFSDRSGSDISQEDLQAAGSTADPKTLIGAVLYLDKIAFHALRLPDVRLLWSEDERFQDQFSKKGDPLAAFSSFKPFSLYPVRFVHDISFWENPQRVFEEADLFEVVREVADDVVTSVTLVDKFDSAAEGKTSRCYRLVFQSYDSALSYITSWKLQSVLRLKVAQRLGVTLR